MRRLLVVCGITDKQFLTKHELQADKELAQGIEIAGKISKVLLSGKQTSETVHAMQKKSVPQTMMQQNAY